MHLIMSYHPSLQQYVSYKSYGISARCDHSGEMKKTQRHRWLTLRQFIKQYLCIECCNDNPPESSPMSKLYLTASGGSASIRSYLVNNIASRVTQSLSPPAREIRGKIGQRHLVCKHRWIEGLHTILCKQLALPWFVRYLFCRHIYSRFEFLGCRDYKKIARKAIVTILIQTLTSVQDTYVWRNNVLGSYLSYFYQSYFSPTTSTFTFDFKYILLWILL